MKEINTILLLAILSVLIVISFLLEDIKKAIEKPKVDYTERLQNIEKVLSDMNTLEFYKNGKKIK